MKDNIRGPRENHNILIAVKLVYGRLRASLAIVLSSLGCRYLWKRWYVSFDCNCFHVLNWNTRVVFLFFFGREWMNWRMSPRGV